MTLEGRLRHTQPFPSHFLRQGTAKLLIPKAVTSLFGLLHRVALEANWPFLNLPT